MRVIAFILFVFLTRFSFAQQIEKIGNGVIPDIPVYTFAWNDSIILRGNFTHLPDNTPCEGMALWDGTQWKDLALNSTNSDRKSLLIYNGQLLLGGGLSLKGNPNSLPLLQLNGNTWVNVFGVTSSNSLGYIIDMIVYKNELYVAGKLQRIGGKYVKNIAKWDGVSWSDVGGGCGEAVNGINSLAIFNDELYVGGFFDNAGPVVAKHVAKWNGANWFALDSGVHQGGVAKIIPYKNKLIVVGGFTRAGSYSHLSNVYKGSAIWDGTSWSRLDGFMELAYPSAIKEYRGELYIGSIMNSKTKTVNDTVMMSWDGTKYTNRLGVDAEIYSLSVVNDKLIITGEFEHVLTKTISKMASYYLDPVGVPIIKKSKAKFIVYPNPSSNQVYISNGSNTKNIRLIIRNSLSKKIKEIGIEFNKVDFVLSIEDLSTGMYFIQFYDGEILLDTQKLMVY